jgi:exopolysaccharide biosynthesis WecB/TagA/CpsF family protein
MIDRGKHNVLGVRIDAVDYEGAEARILEAARARRPLAVSALAVHGVMTGVLDPAQRHRLNRLDLVAPDGQPVRWALNLLHRTRLPDRVYGPTLMLRICARAAEEGLPIFLYGATEDLLADLRATLLKRFPGLQIAGSRPSSFRRISAEEQTKVADTIRDSGAALTFVGLGCPRQEAWVFEMREALSQPLLAVGAAFAFHAGRLPQAPPRMQAWGLEWLYRLMHEPLRLWRRYLLLNPLYVVLLLLQGSRLWTIDPESTPKVVEALRHG